MSKPKIVLSKFLISKEFQNRLKLVAEHKDLFSKLEHLEKRYNIDKISDPAEALEIKKEIMDIQDRLKEILDKLSFC